MKRRDMIVVLGLCLLASLCLASCKSTEESGAAPVAGASKSGKSGGGGGGMVLKSAGTPASAQKKIDTLTAQLDDADAAKRAEAAEGLAAFGPASRDAVPQLVECLDDDSAAVRTQAAEALSRVGTGAKEAAPALVEALEDEAVTVRVAAASGLIVMREGEAAMPVLLAALEDEDEGIRLLALLALEDLGYLAAEAAPAVEALLETEESAGMRDQAERTLGRIR